MAKSPIRKTIERLIKKVEDLEDQSFAQKLQIDELENKLQRTEDKLKEYQANPFNLPMINVPFVQTPAPAPMPQTQQLPWNIPGYPYTHVCTPGATDWTGGCYCTSCGAQISGPTWTITSTADNTTLCLADPSAQSSTDVEPALDLEISWIVPDDFNKKD